MKMFENVTDKVVDFFGVFSDIWTSASWGEMADIFWPLNAIACAIIVLEAFAMLHLSYNRWNRLAYGMVSFGAFTYLAGELGGKYLVVAPVETLFHWSIVFGLASTVFRRVYPRLHFGSENFASSHQRAEVGETSGGEAWTHSKVAASGGKAPRR